MLFRSCSCLARAAGAALAKHEHSLSLRGLVALDDDVVSQLAGYSGILKLSNQTAISASGRAALAVASGTVRFE